MASQLKKTIRRETESVIFDRSKYRNIIVSVEPTRSGAVIGLRIKGCRDIYRLPVGAMYVQAVNNHLAKVERKAKQIVKNEKISLRSARVKARKECAKDLRDN